jgi:hypothetical protein
VQRCLLCTRCEIVKERELTFRPGESMRLAVCVLLGAEMCVCILFRQPHTHKHRPERVLPPQRVSLPSPRVPRPNGHISSLPPRLVSTHDRSFSNALNPMVGKMVGVLEKPQT